MSQNTQKLPIVAYKLITDETVLITKAILKHSTINELFPNFKIIFPPKLIIFDIWAIYMHVKINMFLKLTLISIQMFLLFFLDVSEFLKAKWLKWEQIS